MPKKTAKLHAAQRTLFQCTSFTQTQGRLVSPLKTASSRRANNTRSTRNLALGDAPEMIKQADVRVSPASEGVPGIAQHSLPGTEPMSHVHVNFQRIAQAKLRQPSWISLNHEQKGGTLRLVIPTIYACIR